MPDMESQRLDLDEWCCLTMTNRCGYLVISIAWCTHFLTAGTQPNKTCAVTSCKVVLISAATAAFDDNFPTPHLIL